MFEHVWLLLTAPSPPPWYFLLAAMDLMALISVPSVLLARRGRPQAALVWILLLLGAPTVGLFGWWLIGRHHLARPRRRHLAASLQVNQALEARDLLPTGADFTSILPMRWLPQDAMTGAFPATPGNRVDVLCDATEAYPALERMIRRAGHHVHLLFYIFQADAVGRRFRDLLVERAKAGVQVRLLFDAVGSPDLDAAFLAPLRAAGGQAAAFLPVTLSRRMTLNFRNHRKIVVVDGVDGYTGGINIGQEYLTDWHDLGVALRGPIVAQLQAIFADDWLFATAEELTHRPYFRRMSRLDASAEDREGSVEDHGATAMMLASGPDTTHNLTHDAFFLAITEARRRIWLMTPYFIPSPTLQVALRVAVYRGVDVALLLPGRSDVPIARLAARSYYPELLASGVRIFEYEPAVLHGKLLIFDDDLVVLGSANLDTRSFRLNFEAGCFLHSKPVVQAMAALFERDLAQSRPVTEAQIGASSWFQRVTESAANILGPLL